MYPLLQRQVVPEWCGMSETGKLLADQEQQIKELWDVVQILVSRYPNCETVITAKEFEERPDVGVVSTVEQPDGGLRMWVRQR